MKTSEQKLIPVDKIRTLHVDSDEHLGFAEVILEEHRKLREKSNKSQIDEGHSNDYIANNGNSFIAIPKMKKPYFWQFKKKRLYKQECELILKKYKEWAENEGKI